MYESFFNLTSKPFQLNPDPRFFYRSTGHRRALAYMRYGLQQGQGFIIVTGDVGTGKTMLVNSLFRELDRQSIVAARIVSSNVKDVDLLRLIAAEFEIPFEKLTKAALLSSLVEFFKNCRKEGKRVLLVIDEVQNLPRSALEELRMLSNFEEDGVPFVQSFLLGQREFRGVLRAPGLEQLRQRVIAAYHLRPLSAPEVKAYVEHRMIKAGWNGDPVIEEPIFRAIHEASDGVPRRINTLFDRVLLNGFLDESRTIGLSLVENVIKEIEGELGSEDESQSEEIRIEEKVQNEHGVARQNAECDEVEMDSVRRQLQTMQREIDALEKRMAVSGKLDATDASPEPSVANSWRGSPTLPVWTATFFTLSVLTFAALVSFGTWLLLR